MSSNPVGGAGQSEYQTIFQSSVEVPRFYVSYRWWEDEATTILWAFNVQEISRVIRYGLFHDENLPRSSLQSRNADTIDNFLVALAEPHEHQLLANLSHLQRVEEILRRSCITPPHLVPWSWFPPPPGQFVDARAIATAIEAESVFHFRQIPFEEIVRASLGYHAASIEWFLQQHTAFYICLLDHLRTYPEDIPRYADVEKHLRTRSPFAQRALVQCIVTIRSSGNRNIPQPIIPGFDFVAGPIQRLFRDQPPSLATILKIFSVLAVRYRRQYIHAPTMDWSLKFDTAIPFLEDCLSSTSAANLARTLTSTDEIDFGDLPRQSLIAEDAAVKHLLANWRALSISTWECCCALPDLIPHLQECAQCLYTAHNYHSLTAILGGLRIYSISKMQPHNSGDSVGAVVMNPVLPENTLFLMDPTRNYSAYRQHYRDYPGIPFLVPHIRDYQQHGEYVLQPLLQYLQSKFSFSS